MNGMMRPDFTISDIPNLPVAYLHCNRVGYLIWVVFVPNIDLILLVYWRLG